MKKLNSLLLYLISFLSITKALANNPPVIHDLPSTLLLSEDASIGTVITTFKAEDTDGPRPLSFELTTADTSSLVKFVQRQTTSTSTNVDIILISHLDRDYASPEKHLYFKVSDGSSEVARHVNLYIIDINDEIPVFVNLPYTMYLSETTSVGMKVYDRISATDPDTGPGGIVTYSLTPRETSFEGYVCIDENTGVVTLKKELDYEHITYYAFDLIAKDGHGLTSESVPLLIFVQDVQDSPPIFVQYKASMAIDEESPKGTRVQQVIAVDGDRGIPNNISYALSNGTDYFNIDPKTGWITTNTTIDLENHEFPHGNVLSFGIIASEVNGTTSQNCSTSANIVLYVTISDINDNPPEFIKCDNFSAILSEIEEDGDMITLSDGCNIHIIDRDQGDNSYFGVSLEVDGEPFETLNIVPSTAYSEGFFTLKVLQNQISDLPDMFNLTIIAQELATKEAFSTTEELLVTVRKANVTTEEDKGPGLSIPILILGIIGGLTFGVLCAAIVVVCVKYFKKDKEDDHWATRTLGKHNKIHPGDVTTTIANGIGPTLIQLPNDEKETPR